MTDNCILYTLYMDLCIICKNIWIFIGYHAKINYFSYFERFLYVFCNIFVINTILLPDNWYENNKF